MLIARHDLNGIVRPPGMSRPEMRERLSSKGAEALIGSPEDLGDLIKREMMRTARLVKDAGLKPQ